MDTPRGPELWVRIFPDQISINAHEPGLTNQEIIDGQVYWNAIWVAGDPAPCGAADPLQMPWRDLASRYGAPRAAWIACQTTPPNANQQPAAANLTLKFGLGTITFTSCRLGATDNDIQIAIDVSSSAPAPVTVSGDLITIYAKWDGTLHTTSDVAAYFPSPKTSDGGSVAAVAGGIPHTVGATTATNLTGGNDPSPPPYPNPTTAPHSTNAGKKKKTDSSWETAAVADALPDKWTVVLVSGSEKSWTQSTQPVRADLPVSLNPNGDPFPAGSPVDPDLRWLVDFKEAWNAGMALTIPISNQQRRTGFDRLFVYGLRSTDSSGSYTIGNLLDAHHYTDGFAMVTQGAPTNHTSDASSAYSRKDLDNATSFQVERRSPLIQDPQQEPDADGNRFATLIGLDPCKMKHVQYASGTGSRNGSDMLMALWPSTLGYFLTQMIASTSNSVDIENARQYVIANAFPRGPIAGFRVGRTPYGVLPVTSLLRYKLTDYSSSGPTERNLVTLLKSLRPAWLAASQNAPHMQTSGDPDNQLVAVLGMDASSMAFRGRQVYGNYFLWNYSGFAGMTPTAMQAWLAEQTTQGRQALDSFGFKELDPRVIHLGLVNDSFPIQLPIVQADPLSETDRLVDDADLGQEKSGKTGKVNYIQWLQQASVDAIRADRYPGPKPTSLLYKILRQSLIVEYARNASAVEISAGRLQPSQIREPELVGMGRIQEPVPVSALAATVAEPVSVWEVLDRPIDPSSNQKWKDYLVQIASQPDSNFPALNDLYASMGRLATLPTAELDRLMTETLDACSHRLDVWVTSIATAILQRTRETGMSTVNLACYGWVEEVRPTAQRATIQGAALRQVKSLDAQRAAAMKNSPSPTPVLEPLADNGGFILAPSQDQAMVAAILRSGYMSHKAVGDEGALSMDLSSERVRGALWLLEGIRQGQSLNALLGYQFEAGLHDLGLSQYIKPFRDMFPMAANQVIPSNRTSDIVAASNVVDGLALRSAWDGGVLTVGGYWGTDLPNQDQTSDQQTIISVFEKLDSQADALSELSIAETIFQTVRGNFPRAGGLLDAISKGNRPPDPEVIATPRGGLDLTHRIAVLFAGLAPQDAWQAWQAAKPRARALAEPRLDAWLSLLLPDPTPGPRSSSVVCQVNYVDPDSGKQKSVSVGLADLNLAPLDCIAMGECSTGATQRSELEMRILYAAGVPPLADPGKIKIDHPPSSGPALSFPDLLFLWKNFRLLINHARPLTPQDLTVPENKVADPSTLLRLQELRSRAKAALAALLADLTNLQNSPVPSLPKNLMACSFYGVPGSVPYSNSANDARLKDQAQYVSNALQDRYTKASQLITDTAGQDDLLKAFALIFGKDFKVLASFDPADPTIQDAVNESSALLGSDPSPSSRWWTQLTHVRPAIARIDTALCLARVVGAEMASSANLRVAQLPFVPGDQWLALPWDPTKPPSKGRVAFAFFTPSDPRNQSIYAGLLIDEWLERIPSIDEKAGVAFHYEEPKARPPQALLLGVCPDHRENWDDDLVTAVLEETLELAKIRTVDLDSVQKIGHVLPALYFPLNLRGATISANFAIPKEIVHGPTTAR